jgi:hypothetical protein
MAERMAAFCLGYGVQPSEYRALTRLERQAFHDEAERIKARLKG